MHLGTFLTTNDNFFWQGKKTVIHWDLFPVGGILEPWVIAPDVMLALGYMRRHLLDKERFHMWDCWQIYGLI